MAKTPTQYPGLGIDTEVAYFDQIVRPDKEDFVTNQNIREALHLATSLNNLLEWHFHSHVRRSGGPTESKDLKEFRRRLEADFRFLAAIRDLCDASKHCGLNRDGFELSEIKLVVGRGGYGGYGEGMGYNVAGAYGSGQEEPRQYTKDGHPRWLIDVFLAAFQYWETVIQGCRANMN
jgi:hypothetical protein